MFKGQMRLLTGLLAAALPLLASSTPARGGLVFNGGTGAISFGVAPYGGAPNVGGPTYIADNVTGRNDILSSPGLGTQGGYLTASPVVANNIASYAGNLPLAAFQVGGGNASGAFGSAAMSNFGNAVAVNMADSGAGGGTASYAIGAGNITYTVAGAAIAAGSTYGAYLSMAGLVPNVGNADVMALRVHISDTSGVFGAGGTDLPQLVLAISRNGTGSGIVNYNIVTIGGAAGGNAALILDNGTTGAFRALAVDNQALAAALPVGDVISLSYALTAFADPANFSSFDPTNSLDLLNLTGPLASNDLIATPAFVPEPASIGMLVLGIVSAIGYAAHGRRKRRHSE
jgi:PEP-CTERM motif